MTPAEVADQVALFVGRDQVTELRALHVGQKGRTFAGFFDGRHLTDLARHALALSREAAGVYFVPNPVDPALLARRPNTTADVYRDRPPLTRDADVLERRYLLIDLDPARFSVPVRLATPTAVLRAAATPPDRPTTAREVAAARVVARAVVRPLMRSHGFADPVEMLSGNGVHLVYRLPTPLPGGLLGVRDPLAVLLAAVAARADTVLAAVDPHTYTPARMLKVPGTRARKGEPTPARPHRTARVLEVPDGWTHPAEPAGLADDDARLAGTRLVE